MARLNLSHGSIKSNLKLLKQFQMAKRLRPHKQIGFMMEARGREIRITEVVDQSGFMNIRSNSMLTLNCTSTKSQCTPKTLYCNSDAIMRYIQPNDVLYIDDGKVVCLVLEINDEGCAMEVKVGGTIKSFSQIRILGG